LPGLPKRAKLSAMSLSRREKFGLAIALLATLGAAALGHVWGDHDARTAAAQAAQVSHYEGVIDRRAADRAISYR
jgi:hypothetical protein